MESSQNTEQVYQTVKNFAVPFLKNPASLKSR